MGDLPLIFPVADVQSASGAETALLALLQRLEAGDALCTQEVRWIAVVVRRNLDRKQRDSARSRHLLAAWELMRDDVPSRQRLSALRRQIDRAEVQYRRYLQGCELPEDPVRVELVRALAFGALPDTERGLRKAIYRAMSERN